MSDERQPDERARGVLSVALAIALHSHGKVGDGELPCPVCPDGTINYSIRGKAVAARCTSPDCVWFIS